MAEENLYLCEHCGAEYKSRAGRAYHRRICPQNPDNMKITPVNDEKTEETAPGPVASAPAPGEGKNDIKLADGEDYPGDKPALPEEEDNIPTWIIIPLMIAAGLAVLLIIFREKIRELFGRGKPPARPTAVLYG